MVRKPPPRDEGARARDLSPLECALLALLRQQPRSGYDLRKLFAETPFVHFSDSPGAVYPALQGLERRGLVHPRGAAGRAAFSGGGRRRRALAITSSGRRALRRWLRAPVTRDELTRPLNTPMLRFAFMEEVLGRRACVSFLEQYEGELRAYVAELRAYAGAHLKGASRSGRLAFASGLQGYVAQAAWARRARRALGKEGD